MEKLSNKKIFLYSLVASVLVLFLGNFFRNVDIGNYLNANNNGLSNLANTSYVPLSGTGENAFFDEGEPDLSKFLQRMLDWGVAIAIILAVMFMIFGGIEYMTTDAVFQKSEGKKRVQSALAGLILALLSWLILYTINPNLLNTDPGSKASIVTAPPTPAPASTTPPPEPQFGGEVPQEVPTSNPTPSQAQQVADYISSIGRGGTNSF